MDQSPIRTRTRRKVGNPTAAVMRRTWRLRPSQILSSNQLSGTVCVGPMRDQAGYDVQRGAGDHGKLKPEETDQVKAREQAAEYGAKAVEEIEA